MRNWLPRGLVFAALMVVIRLIQGVLINAFEAQAGLISSLLVLLFVIAVLIWGFIDGRADATATPDPDRRKDLAMTWLGSGLLAGVVSGALAWLISLVDRDLYVGGLLSELTTFAAFTALLVFVAALGAVAVGRRVVDRKYAKLPQRHHGLAAHDSDQTPTDVFAAVGAGAAAGAAGAEASGAAASGQVGTVASGQVGTAAPGQVDTVAPGQVGTAAPGQVVTWTAEDLATEDVAADDVTVAPETWEATEPAAAPETTPSAEETTAVIPPAVDEEPGETR